MIVIVAVTAEGCHRSEYAPKRSQRNWIYEARALTSQIIAQGAEYATAYIDGEQVAYMRKRQH